MSLSVFDHQMMSRALQLAARGSNTVTPNPAVGCVITRDEQIVGEGWHQKAGEPHAEVHALAAAGEDANGAKGATVYVTLEPCSHFGKTPPCAEALVKAGVDRVVYAMQDSNPDVSGRGLQLLGEADIVVEGPLLEEQARQLNKGFIKRQQTGLPWVTVKLAMSLDGRTAMASGESQWITGAEARNDVQRLRAQSCAIVSGINTVLQDDARLTVRAIESSGTEQNQTDQKEIEPKEAELRQPLRVILDSQQRLPENASLLATGGAVLQVTATELESISVGLASAGRLERLALPCEKGKGVDLPRLMDHLAQRQCNQVLVEAGASVAGQFLQAGLVDEIVVYMAATLLGSDARPLFDIPLVEMSQQIQLEIQDVRSVGADIRMTFVPKNVGAAVAKK